MLPVPNVQETSEGQGGLGEGEARGGQGRGGEPGRPRGSGPVFHAQGAGDPWLVRAETCVPGKPRQPRGWRGGVETVESGTGNARRCSKQKEELFCGCGGGRRHPNPVGRQESRLWMLPRVYCAGSQAESGGVRRWGGGRGNGGRGIGAEEAACARLGNVTEESAVASNKR